MLAALLVAPPARAHAGTSGLWANKPSASELQRAEELYDNGKALFAEGSYAAAATAFEQAYELSGNVDMLYNVALAHDRAGSFEPAIAALDRYRALAPASERAALDERKQSLVLRLEKQREAEAMQAGASPPDDDAMAPTVESPKAPPDTAPPPTRRRLRPVGWAAIGVGAASLVAGTVLGAISLSRTRTAKRGCESQADGILCGDDVADAARSSRPLAIGADVSFAIAAAAAITAVAFLVIDLRRPKRSQARVRPRGGQLAITF